MLPSTADDETPTRDGWHAWLDHPQIARHYRQRSLIDGAPWEQWVATRLGGRAGRSLHLGCGAGEQSLFLYEKGWSRAIDGIDLNEDLIALGERGRAACRAPGRFRIADVNRATLPGRTYDLIFSCHRFHHFVALEHVLDQVHASLTPRGLLVVEGFVGPSRFQWTETQIQLVRALISALPDRLRTFRWGATKPYEGRPARAAVTAASSFESIRSAEVLPLFAERFDTVVIKRLGGTLQHLLYNGIVHNFAEADPEACRLQAAIAHLEDVLVDDGILPSDFVLMIGQRR